MGKAYYVNGEYTSTPDLKPIEVKVDKVDDVEPIEVKAKK